MDVGKLLKNLNSLNEYIDVTQDSSEKCRNSRIQLNMSTVLALKKIRSLEVEYVNKCEEIGIACVIFERLLYLPPSKTWGVLSKELVSLLRYWLDAVRKHLVKHSPHWWIFLKSLLKYLKEIRLKDSSMPNILVEHTAECLFDLATTEGPDVMQRYEILHCFNMYCSESSREIRFALRNKFGHSFTKLASYMCNCGSLPTQYSIMETLLRWLLPRQDRTLRITSASKWFPARLYASAVVDIFLERPWMNFFQDARDFLNAHNGSNDLITSVVCRKLTVGDIIIIKDTDKNECWLDVNCTSRCMSVLLDPRVLDAFGSTNHKSFETFIVNEDNTETAKLSRESDILTLSVQTYSPPQVLPSCIKLGDDVSCDVTALISSRSDVKRLDCALRMIFCDKYQLLLDLEQESMLSPVNVPEQSKTKSEDDPRFSNPVEVRRRKHSGYIVKSRQPFSCASPSSVSTSSLAQLHEKLAALPRYKFDKEPIGVCALPDLSIVTEVSEADAQSTAALNRKPYGVCHKNFNALDSSRKSQSDSETSRKYPESKNKPKGRLLSPIVREQTPSCLLVATIGSADDSVINDTVERLSKSKDYNPDNIVNLLVQEALNAKQEKGKEQIDSGINTREKTTQELNENVDAIENTPNVENKVERPVKKYPKCVSPTSDESNTEAISDTPDQFVNTRRKKKDNATKDTLANNSFDIHVVEEFFSQHFVENNEKEVIISPTLAKKINETSSEYSDDLLDDGLMLMGNDLQSFDSFNINNIEVIECLNNIVDKVCDEFNKCSEYLNKDNAAGDDTSDLEDDLPLKQIISKVRNINDENRKVVQPTKIKLKYKISSKKDNTRSRTIKRNKRLESGNTAKMSTIVEDNAEAVAESNDPVAVQEIVQNEKNALISDQAGEAETPNLRRKRKLFSPKDEKITREAPEHTNSQENEFIDSNTKKETPKSTLSYKPYKDIEQERKRHIRLPRNRKSRKFEPPSPRTKKMNDLFDKVKESSNCEQVKLINRASEVYNFSTDSEDDFKEKKIAISKKTSNTTVGSEESTVLRRGRSAKRIDHNCKDEPKKVKRKVTKRKKTSKIEVNPVSDLIDERMREGKEVLDTSITVEIPETVETEPVLVLKNPPEMEVVTENTEKVNKTQPKGKRSKKTKSKTTDLLKATKKTVDAKLIFDKDRTESPLPGLVVEQAQTPTKRDADLSANMVDKFKRICQNPEKYINESNNTQNLLSDSDKNMISPQTVNITDEIIQLELQDELKQNRQTKRKKTSTVKPKKKSYVSNTEKVKGDKRTSKKISLPGSDANSYVSIATVGITGHGDSEEAPPSPKLIGEQLEHRHLESEYLDRSTKDYFEKLTEEINQMNATCDNDKNKYNNRINTSLSDKANKEDIKTKSSVSPKSVKSPVVSIERISLEDISRWLPSRRNSETDTNSSVSIKSKSSRKSVVIPQKVESKLTTDLDNDIDVQEAIERSLTRKKSPNRSKSYIKNSESPVSVVIQKRNPLPKKTEKPRVQPKRQVKNTPKSCISPIKLFESCIKDVDKLSQSTLSEDEDYMSKIQETFETLRRKENRSQSSKAEESSQAKEHEIEILHITPRINLTQSSDSESIQDKMSTFTKIEDSRILKRKLEDDRDDRKKKKVEHNNNMGDFISASGNTESSVDDWFKRSEPSGSRDEVLHGSVRESLQNVMEKLDTTLIEIHQNTSKKFVHLFVSAQQQLCDMKAERHDMYKRVAADLLSGIVRLIDDKFSHLDKTCQEQDMLFIKQLKEQTSGVIREDCKQKRVMVQLLKEDVQAVLEHMRKNNK